MNKLQKAVIISYLMLLSTAVIFGKDSQQKQNESVGLENSFLNQPNKKPMVGTNPYTWSPIFFSAENGISGRYWAGDGSKKFPGKAFIEDEEYTNVVVIEKNKIEEKENRKLRRAKMYLGLYIDPTTSIEYYLYGTKKNLPKSNNGPDADVRTVIAIEEDYGIGE